MMQSCLCVIWLAGYACSLYLIALEDRERPFKMQPFLDSLHIYDFYGDVCLYHQVHNIVKCDLRGQLQSHVQNTLILDNHQDCGKQNRVVTDFQPSNWKTCSSQICPKATTRMNFTFLKCKPMNKSKGNIFNTIRDKLDSGSWPFNSLGDRRQEALHQPTGSPSQQPSRHLEDVDSTGDTLIELHLLIGQGVLLG